MSVFNLGLLDCNGRYMPAQYFIFLAMYHETLISGRYAMAEGISLLLHILSTSTPESD
jgi:hypothetical protein